MHNKTKKHSSKTPMESQYTLYSYCLDLLQDRNYQLINEIHKLKELITELTESWSLLLAIQDKDIDIVTHIGKLEASLRDLH
jgi:flagellin-specific chaperone FliS